ncbi:MAG: hypothetical protein M1381_09040 [Deltaproteobacteria bacterium]|nr:hypothetical protein [Deltaproteobacteria bacterium]MCL5792894.1 hypothetical protein [Deltaproteobacteria bacterium]
MIKTMGIVFLILITPAAGFAGYKVPVNTSSTPFGIGISTGYFGTKVSTPGFGYISPDNWIESWYIEGSYTVHKHVDVFANYGYSNMIGNGTNSDITTTLTTHIITAGVRYQYELSKRFIPYGELGVSGYIGNVDVSAQLQDINKTAYAVAPEISAGFYLPVIIPSNSHTTVGIQFSFGLFRDYLVKAAYFDFGYLGKITIDGQRITIGLRVAF